MKSTLSIFIFLCFSLLSHTQTTENEVVVETEEKDPLMKHRLYKEIGANFLGTQNGVSIGPRYKIGGNLILVNRYVYSLGLNFNILSASWGIGPNASATATAPGIGIHYMHRIKDNMGLEFNLPFGYGGFSVQKNGKRGAGLYAMPDIKWRKENFSIGLHYTVYSDSQNFKTNFHDALGFSFGFNFSPEKFFNDISNALYFVGF